MSCGRHWYFFCTWHLHLSFAARFSNMPYFGSHWAVTRLRNFIKSGTYIAKHFVFMLIIFQVGRQSTSIRFFVCAWIKYHYFWTGVYLLHGIFEVNCVSQSLQVCVKSIWRDTGYRSQVSSNSNIWIFYFYAFFWLTRVLTRGCLVSGRWFECFFFY